MHLGQATAATRLLGGLGPAAGLRRLHHFLVVGKIIAIPIVALASFRCLEAHLCNVYLTAIIEWNLDGMIDARTPHTFDGGDWARLTKIVFADLTVWPERDKMRFAINTEVEASAAVLLER